MKIVDFNSFKNSVNKLDSMAQVDMTKPNTVFPQKEDKSSAKEFFDNFFNIADGNKAHWDV